MAFHTVDEGHFMRIYQLIRLIGFEMMGAELSHQCLQNMAKYSSIVMAEKTIACAWQKLICSYHIFIDSYGAIATELLELKKAYSVRQLSQQEKPSKPVSIQEDEGEWGQGVEGWSDESSDVWHSDCQVHYSPNPCHFCSLE